MKQLTIVCMAILLSVAFSCSNKKSESAESTEETTEVAAPAETYSLVSDSTKVKFTAYKTTGKVPVGGTFNEINVTNVQSAATPLEALNGVQFGVPVSSLFTNDATGTRDPKIIEFFFGVMKDTEVIKGTLKVAGDSCSIDLTMNGATVNVPLETAVSGETFTVKGVLDLEKWNALDAVASINKACEALHTGADGVSKTWSEVAVEATLQVKKN